VALVTAPLSDDLLRDIEEKAKAATCGPWEVEREDDYRAFVSGGTNANLVATVGNWAYPVAQDIRNADYIAACSPSVVISLLERLKKAEAERDLLRALVSEAHDVLPDHEVELRRRLVEAL
jgi:2,3-bisphosphoglycerate-independent phosphoglycerate mutase